MKTGYHVKWKLWSSEEWMERALCQQIDPELWFAEKGEYQKTLKAAAVCRACPVQTRCLLYAMDNNEIHGVWGGMTPEKRRDLRKEVGWRARLAG